MRGVWNIREEDIKRILNGTAMNCYSILGAHPTENGVQFTVYAPAADCVSVVGAFHVSEIPMECKDGFWHALVENAKIGDTYQYKIEKDGKTVLKNDPFAFGGQDMSVICAQNAFVWTDADYMAERKQKNPRKNPMNIYEVYLGSFRKNAAGENLNFREMAPYLTNYALDMGYNYIEFLPVSEHPLDNSWGYQPLGLYAVTARYGTKEDFKYLINALHEAGIGVILDWVVGHFPQDKQGLYRFDGTPLFESCVTEKAENRCWGTLNFDFEKPFVRSFLQSNAIYWLNEFHIDGLRVDAVENMLYHDFGKNRCDALKNKYEGYENLDAFCFFRTLNTYIAKQFPGCITAAEDSSARKGITEPWEIGGLNFTFKWNLGWMHDSLSYLSTPKRQKENAHDKLTQPMLYAFDEHFILPLSHDEVTHGKGSMYQKIPGEMQDKAAIAKAYYLYMYGMPGKKLNFSGNEFLQDAEWQHQHVISWNLLKEPLHAGVQAFCRDLNWLYLEQNALWLADDGWHGFGWCNANDKQNQVYSFVRYGEQKSDCLVFVINFSDEAYADYSVGVPYFTEYKEVLNSDDGLYNGKNRKNRALLLPKLQETGEMPYSISISLPPYSGMVLKPFDKMQEKTGEGAL